jgi:7-carboxy-7-deazaguanine synthase
LTTPLLEIFSSVQGEGLYVGCRQIFLRFAGCNLKCAYCDTAFEPSPVCRCERNPGRRDFINLPNPLTAFQVAAAFAGLNPQIHHSVSLTGGEPLLHNEFLRALIPLLPKLRSGVYLETNGSLPRELSSLIHLVDIIAMDIKLPGVAGLSSPLWETHKEFLAVASRKKVFIKVVVDENTRMEELEKAFDVIKEVGDFPLVIQPLTRDDGCPGIEPEQLIFFQESALRQLNDVRVIPQAHKMLKCL